MTASRIPELTDERLLVREQGSGTRDILEQSLAARGLHISDFKMQHDFDMIWEKGSIYTDKFLSIADSMTKTGWA